MEEGDVLCQRYAIRRAIKAGGMGSVFLAQDSHLDGLCAVKEMHPTSDNWAQRRFREEATLLSSLSHPRIPQVRDFFVVDGLHYIVMDFVEGKTLQQEWEEAHAEGKPGVDPEQARQDALDLLSILEYLHSLSIIHRDIKPSNLIREKRSGKLFLVDFGLARSVSDNTQTTAGTLVFCSPEQMLGKADARSDLYSVAASLYVLLTGLHIQMGTCKPILFHRPELKPELAQAIDTGLRLDPEQRYPSAAAMREAILTPLAPPRPPNHTPKVALALVTMSLLGLGFSLRPTPPAQPTPTPSASRTPVEEVKPGLAPVMETPIWARPLKTSADKLEDDSRELLGEVENQARLEGVIGPGVRYFHRFEPPELEVGIVLPEGRPAPKGLKNVLLPGGQVARLVHVGDYDRLPERRRQLESWIKAEGLELKGDYYEVYRIAAPLQPDSTRWETDLCWPVRKPKRGR